MTTCAQARLKFLSYLGLCDIMYLSVMMHFVSMHQKVQELCFENQKIFCI